MKRKNKLLVVSVMISLFSTCALNAASASSTNHRLDGLKAQKATTLVYLDKVLSPFEDITEYSIDHNQKGLLHSVERIKKLQADKSFQKNLEQKSLKNLDQKIVLLNKFISEKNYAKSALVSTEIFKYNIDHFKSKESVKEQINIENLDYMGFEIIALTNQNDIDYAKINQILLQSKKSWRVFSTQVKDKNMVDAFALLFSGLDTSIKQKNNPIIKTFANLDLALVDVLEKQFQ